MSGTGPGSGQWALAASLDDFLCFTPGCRIATPLGARPVEDLAAGDRVLTRDNGMQEIAWIAAVTLGSQTRPLPDRLAPVLIRAGALGNGLPERDLVVSPGHRMLLCTPRARRQFGEGEVLVAARDLTDRPGITRLAPASVTYAHFMCAHHEIVLADGAWSESFQPGDRALAALAPRQRDELLQIFPGLRNPAARGRFAPARRALGPEEARLLLDG